MNDLNRVKAWSSVLRLPIMKKTVQIIEGQHPSIFKGIGQDFEEFSLYQPGFETKDIDWKASAKYGDLIMRRFRADSNTNMVFIADSGREMVTRSESGERKIDVLKTVCFTMGYLSSARFDAVGMLAGDEGRMMHERSKLNFNEVNAMLNKIEKITLASAPKRSYAKLLEYCNNHFTKRTFIILIFDETSVFSATSSFLSYVRKLKQRHDILAVSIRSVNPFLDELPNIQGHVLDIDNFKYMPAFFRNSNTLRIADKNFKLNRRRLNTGMKQIGVAHINVKGSDDFLSKLVRLLKRSEVARFK
jgi:uncharacterized protein (DUF58 family)